MRAIETEIMTDIMVVTAIMRVIITGSIIDATISTKTATALAGIGVITGRPIMIGGMNLICGMVSRLEKLLLFIGPVLEGLMVINAAGPVGGLSIE